LDNTAIASFPEVFFQITEYSIQRPTLSGYRKKFKLIVDNY
jgi:hypothetical protein